jgi:hypothetical protein
MNSTYDVVFNDTRAMRIAIAKQYLCEFDTKTKMIARLIKFK